MEREREREKKKERKSRECKRAHLIPLPTTGKQTPRKTDLAALDRGKDDLPTLWNISIGILLYIVIIGSGFINGIV